MNSRSFGRDHDSQSQSDLSQRFKLLLTAPLMGTALLIKPQSLLLSLSLILIGEPLAVIAGIAMALIFLVIGTVPQWGFTASINLCRQWLQSLSQQPPALFAGNLNQNLGAGIYRVHQHFGTSPWSAEFLCKLTMAGGSIFFLWMWLRSVSTGFVKKIQVPPIEPQHAIVTSFGLYLCTSPLSWRWLTFMWWPMAVVAFSRRGRLNKICLSIFFICAMLLQAFFAHTVGIDEVDILSYWNLYGWASLALTLSLIL